MINKYLERRVRILNSIDPFHFTPEEMKRLYIFMPLWYMKHIFAMAVNQGLYLKHIDDNGEIYYSLNKKI